MRHAPAPSNTAGDAPRGRSGLRLAASAAAALLALTACSGSGSSRADDGRANGGKRDRITITPAADSAAVAIDRKVTIRAGDGHITTVKVTAEGPVRAILMDDSLLLRVNLIHEHSHWHGSYRHSHPHWHFGDHAHEHPHPHVHAPIPGQADEPDQPRMDS